MKTYKTIYKTLTIVAIIATMIACDTDEACGYDGDDEKDCPIIDANIGDTCDSNGDGNLDGLVNEFCECISEQAFDCPNLMLNIGDPCDSSGDGVDDGTVSNICECIEDSVIVPTACQGLMQNGDFETITGDPNSTIDNDIDLATFWGPLWASGSLADLFDATTTSFGSSSFVAPTPANGVFAGMWIENSNNSSPSFREGMFNQLNASISPNSGNYSLTFDYAVMSTNSSNPVKIGIYGVNFGGTLPPNPTGMQTPSNLNLYGTGNSVYLGEVVVPPGSTNSYTTVTIPFDTSTLTMPTAGFSHIMITNSHLPLPDFGKMFIAFDEYCLIRE